MAGAWDAVKYGWNVIYWLTIEGIPVVFTERGLGKELPEGFVLEDASLVIDDSSEIGSEIDRRRGISAGLSLGFRLLDTDAVRTYMRRPAHVATLTQDATATAATIHVESTAGWPATGALWLGLERVTYANTTPTTFTGCTRGVVGLPYAHTVTSIGNLATDRPRWWRGRAVTLYASPVNPAGYAPGTTLLTDAVAVWQGKIGDGPIRGQAWWDFQADSIDRLLDRPLLAAVTGTATQTGQQFGIKTGWQVKFWATARDAAKAQLWHYAFSFYPFAAMSEAASYSGQELRDAISNEFLSALTAAGGATDIEGLAWQTVGSDAYYHYAVCLVAPNAAISEVNIVVNLPPPNATNGKQAGPQILGAGVGQTWPVDLHWYVGDDPTQSVGSFLNAPSLSGFALQLDSGDPASVPSTGMLKLKPANDAYQAQVYSYGKVSVGGVGLQFSQLTKLNGSTAGLTPSQIEGAKVEVLYADEGRPNETMLRCLHSSGTGLRSGAWDTLSAAQGYAFPYSSVDGDSFTSLAGTGAVGQLDLRVSPSGASFVDVFGGLVALARLGIAAIPQDDQTVRLKLVLTDAVGADTAYAIGDADLLSVASDPVSSDSKLHPLNSITVTRAPYGATWSSDGIVSGDDGSGDQDKALFIDVPAVQAMGAESLDVTIPATDNSQLTKAAQVWAMSTFAADQTAQAITLMVPPWVKAQVGDLVELDLSHPTLWQYATATPGYVGTARVLGRTFNLRTLQTKLTLLVNSSTVTTSLAPAARVLSWQGAANAPTSIDVPIAYKAHFAKTLAQAVGGQFSLVHYQPGQVESAASKFAVDGVSESAGHCRLAVRAGSWAAGTLDTTKRSTITLPKTLDASTYQAKFAHDGDGTVWS
jgi:hypothetical protein